MTYMAIDQYGQTYHDLGRFPRKNLLERLGRSKAAKMYRERGNSTLHTGYVIAGLWLTLYRVEPFEKES